MEEEKVEEKKKIDILGIIYKVILCILAFLIFVTITTHISLKMDIDEFKRVYPEYDKRYYYYDIDNDRVDIKSIKDIYGNDIKLKINKVPMMYCKEDSCIYVNTSRVFERIYMNPKTYISILVLLSLIVIYLLLNRKEFNSKKYTIITILLIVLVALSMIEEVSGITSYYMGVNKNKNLEHGILIGETENKGYAYKYTVKKKLYYFSSNSKNDTIYYNKEKPEISYNKKNPFNIVILVINVLYIVYIFVLRKNKMKRISQEGEEDVK